MPYRYLWHKCPSLECIIVENITGGFNHGLSKEKNNKPLKQSMVLQLSSHDSLRLIIIQLNKAGQL